jgi:glycosyltransferase involved in cell wall biosynthesis
MISEQVGPLVSVITPTYNRADVLPRALESVLSQDFQDLELIVVDDGSTDGTDDVVARIQDPRVRYLRFAENRGIGAGRHAGVESAKGELIAFVDSDDVWLPGRLTSVVGLFERYPDVDVIFGNYLNIDHRVGSRALGRDQARRGFLYLETERIEDEFLVVRAGLATALLVSHVIGTASVVALRRRVFTLAGNFRTDLSGPEDFELWFRAALKGARFAYTTRPLVERHKDAQSITARPVSFVRQYLQALDYCEATARENGRLDLLAPITWARHRAWRTLVHAYADLGDREAAVHAFRRCLRYGISGRALFYLMGALLGPKAIAGFRRARNTLIREKPFR